MAAAEAPAERGRLMSAKDIRRELGITHANAWKIIRAFGREVKLGRSVYVYREDVDRYFAGHTRPTT